MRRSQQRKRIYSREIRENFARNTHELLVALGSWLGGFVKRTHTQTLIAFLVRRSQSCLGAGAGAGGERQLSSVYLISERLRQCPRLGGLGMGQI